MLFRKCGCLVAHGKCIFRKCFSVLTCLWCKLISVFILPSNTIFRKTERERECASEIAPARKERERERGRREAIVDDPRASTSPVTQRLRTTNLELRLWITPRTQSFDFESHPLTSPANLEARIAVRLRLRLRRHRSNRSHWVRDWEIVGFCWIWPGLMNFFLLGFDEFNRICVNLLKNCIIYLFGSWENVRNNKKMCFPYYFQQHNQTLENIFQTIF